MKKWKFILVLGSIMVAVFSNLSAQRGTAAAGGDHSNSTGSISFTIGLANYEMFNMPGCQMTIGHQQPHEFWVVTEVQSSHEAAEVTVYPNPASDHVVVQVSRYESVDLDLTLYDQNGRPVKSTRFSDGKTVLGLTDLAVGIYFINVSHEGETLKVFKILKAN